MALVKVCDKCRKIVEGQSCIDIEYNVREEGRLLSTPLSTTLCEDCFTETFGTKGADFLDQRLAVHKQDMFERYKDVVGE